MTAPAARDTVDVWRVRQAAPYPHVRDLTFFHEGIVVGTARLVFIEVHGRQGEDVLEGLLDVADIYCIQDELEAWLECNPGRYAWLDAFERTSDDPRIKGQLTGVLRKALSHRQLGLSQQHTGLMFPCPYIDGLLDEQEGRRRLNDWYCRQLPAQPVEGTSLVRFSLDT